MKIVKALNNNMILVRQLGGQELICQGKGIGWHKHAGDEVDESLGAAAKTKDTETKSEGIACGISAIVAGVTEPAMYGINLRYMTPMIGAVIAAGVGGLITGITGVKGYTMGGSPSILSLITFIGGENPMRGVIFGTIAAVIVIALSFGITFVLLKDPDTENRWNDVRDVRSACLRRNTKSGPFRKEGCSFPE